MLNCKLSCIISSKLFKCIYEKNKHQNNIYDLTLRRSRTALRVLHSVNNLAYLLEKNSKSFSSLEKTLTNKIIKIRINDNICAILVNNKFIQKLNSDF